MKVKVIGKTICGQSGDFLALKRGWGYISSIYRQDYLQNEDRVYLQEVPDGISESGAYSPHDLEPYTEPEETEYRQLTEITPRAIFEAETGSLVPGSCFMEEFTRFVNVFDLAYDESLGFENLEREFNTEPEWTDWFINHGFIEKVVEAPKPTYSMGDRFELYGEEYLLSRVGMGTIVLINLRTGNIWTDAIEVKNMDIITHDDLIRMFKSYLFTRI